MISLKVTCFLLIALHRVRGLELDRDVPFSDLQGQTDEIQPWGSENQNCTLLLVALGQLCGD